MRAKLYLVGGYVRDILINRESNDLDYVVVGANETYMTDVLGLIPDNAPFPVYRDSMGNEFALARTEKKIGTGHGGFEPMFSPDVTLEEDLLRRDLTINSVAMSVDSNLTPIVPHEFHDPHGGIQDIKNKIIRHTSLAFSQDPLRVLRVARFASQLHEHGFTIHHTTIELMKSMSASGELESLTSERVLKEMRKALSSKHPEVFFETLRSVGALKVILPEIDNLSGVPQRKEYHPEIDCFVHTMMTLKKSAEHSTHWYTRYMALTHDLGKALTPKEILPSHYMHEKNGLAPLERLNSWLKVPKELKRLSELCMTKHTQVHTIFSMNDGTIIKLLKSLDAERKPEEAKLLALACLADSQGRLGFENVKYPQADFLIELIDEFHSNKFSPKDKSKKIGNIIHEKQKHHRSLVSEVRKRRAEYARDKTKVE